MKNSYWSILNRENLFWEGYCKTERNKTILEIENTINSYGYISDFHMFSDVGICIKIVIEERLIYNLYSALKNYLTLNDFTDPGSESENECTVLLNITFIKGTGNMKIEVPAVPG